MQKTFVTVLLLGSAVATFAQGTVQFSNGALTRVSLWPSAPPGGIPVTRNFNFGLFYGIGESTSLTFLSTQLGVNSTTSAGIIANPSDHKSAMNTVGIPGAPPNEADVWIQIKGWSASFGTDWAAAEEAVWVAGTPGDYFGETPVINVHPLGPSTGPGAALWQPWAGSDPEMFYPLILYEGPEPTTMTLFGLGVAAVLIFRRRK